jgi:hypothetical protein
MPGDSGTNDGNSLQAGAAEPALPGRRRSAPSGGSAVHEVTSVGAYVFRTRSNSSRIRQTAPMVMALSATLNAGKCQPP